MNRKIKKFFWMVVAFMMISPFGTLAADWGINMDSSGNWSVGVGSNGSGAGSGGFGGMFSKIGAYGLPAGSILGIMENFLFWLLAIFGIAGIVGFVISGILYLTAAGDSGQIDKAKTAMNYSIIGIIVGLSGFVIIQAVNSWLSGRSGF